MSEKTVSANVKLIGKNGADILLTVRAGATAGEVENVLTVLAGSLKFAKDKYGLTPAPFRNGNGHAATAADNDTLAVNGDYIIASAQQLVAAQRSKNDTSLMWKVQTDKSQFPVPIYLEDAQHEETRRLLADEGFDLDVFVSENGQLAKHDLQGWRAICPPNDNGFPSKVVKLERV